MILLTIIWDIFIPILFIFILIVGTCLDPIFYFCLRQKMKRQGRFILKEEAFKRVNSGNGMLIFSGGELSGVWWISRHIEEPKIIDWVGTTPVKNIQDLHLIQDIVKKEALFTNSSFETARKNAPQDKIYELPSIRH